MWELVSRYYYPAIYLKGNGKPRGLWSPRAKQDQPLTPYWFGCWDGWCHTCTNQERMGKVIFTQKEAFWGEQSRHPVSSKMVWIERWEAWGLIVVIEVGLGPLRGQVCAAWMSPPAPKESRSGFVTSSPRSRWKERKEEREDSNTVSVPISKMESGSSFHHQSVFRREVTWSERSMDIVTYFHTLWKTKGLLLSKQQRGSVDLSKHFVN